MPNTRSSARAWMIIATLFLTSAPAISNATVVATWADPNSLSFSFADTGTNNDGLGDLTASNTGILLNLPVLGLTNLDASYVMTDSANNPLSTTSQTNNAGGWIDAAYVAGKIVITSDINQGSFTAGQTLLTITFDSAIGVFGNVLGNDTLVGQNIVFSGPALGGYTATSEQFQFSVANLTPGAAILNPADMEAWTATTSFTSSATLVPLPAAVWLFGIGLIGLVAIARRRTMV
jgi:hypothetical protein